MASFNLEKVLSIALMVIIVMLSTVLHEVAHAATANALGDPTAKERGRLTLNPFKHLDLVGSLVLPLLMVLRLLPRLFLPWLRARRYWCSTRSAARVTAS